MKQRALNALLLSLSLRLLFMGSALGGAVGCSLSLDLTPRYEVEGGERAGATPEGGDQGETLGGVPMGGVMMGGVPMGGVPMGGVPMGGVPMGGVPMGGVNVTPAGTMAGMTAGVMAGIPAGVMAGVTAGVTAGMTAGMTAGTMAGTTAGVMMEPGPRELIEVPSNLVPFAYTFMLSSNAESFACTHHDQGYHLAWVNAEGLHTYDSISGDMISLHNNTFGTNPPEPLGDHISLALTCTNAERCALADGRSDYLLPYTRESRGPWDFFIRLGGLGGRVGATRLEDGSAAVIILKDDGNYGLVNGGIIRSNINLNAPSPEPLPALAALWPNGLISLSALGDSVSWVTGAGADEAEGLLQPPQGALVDWRLVSDGDTAYALISTNSSLSLYTLTPQGAQAHTSLSWRLDVASSFKIHSLTLIEGRPWVLVQGRPQGHPQGVWAISPDDQLSELRELNRPEQACLVSHQGQAFVIWTQGTNLQASPLNY